MTFFLSCWHVGCNIAPSCGIMSRKFSLFSRKQITTYTCLADHVEYETLYRMKYSWQTYINLRIQGISEVAKCLCYSAWGSISLITAIIRYTKLIVLSYLAKIESLNWQHVLHKQNNLGEIQHFDSSMFHVIFEEQMLQYINYELSPTDTLM